MPLSIFRSYADRKPASTIATLLREHHSTESFVEESADRELYPSQTWATFATGVEFEKHGVYWYLHRYWPASFPDHWEVPPFDDAWVARYQGEIPAALGALDRFLGDQLEYCLATGRRLLVVTSMGQQGGLEVDPIDRQVLVVDDPLRFAAALGVDAGFETLNAMVPHLSMRFDSIEVAKRGQHPSDGAVGRGGARVQTSRGQRRPSRPTHAERHGAAGQLTRRRPGGPTGRPGRTRTGHSRVDRGAAGSPPS